MKNSYIYVLISLAILNIINVLFLSLDPRNPNISIGGWICLGSIGLLYITSLILCLGRKKSCYFLNLFLAIVSIPVVVLDNLNLFSSPPTSTIYLLNFAFLAIQIPLVVFSIDVLKSYSSNKTKNRTNFYKS